MLATGRGADVARAMALPVFFGMFVELVSLFVVPVLYCGYMEFKLRMGVEDHYWATSALNQTGALCHCIDMISTSSAGLSRPRC